jgi:hypothetical protein
MSINIFKKIKPIIREGDSLIPSGKKKKTIAVAAAIIVLVSAFGSAYYFYTRYAELTKNPDAQAQKEVETLVLKVGKLMELPKDESPTVATIADVSKLKDQAFFKNAANGDKLLAYTKSMQAILYRPSIDKIISVAPIVINSNQETTDQSQSTEKSEK